jgi:DNA-binding MarR family transcriptional regulator
MESAYLNVIALVERLHRQFLEVVKLELDSNAVHDINNVQAMILYNIGDLEMTVGELTLRGCYLGSNVSYNVKKMLENGYIVQERSSHDRRSVRVRLSEKGMALHQKLKRMHERHMASLAQGVVQGEDMVSAHRTLRRLERFLIHIGGVASTSLSFLKGPFGTEIPSVLDGSLDRNRLGAASRVLATR